MGLTDRQLECLRLVGLGKSIAEIAEEMEITPATVQKHIRAACKTLNVRSRIHAARLIADMSVASTT